MPEITQNVGIGGRQLKSRPCILCAGARDSLVNYTTGQGKKSQRWGPRCKTCSAKLRAERYRRTGDSGQKWRDANRPRIREYNALRRQDPEFMALRAYHQRLRKARIRSGQPDDPAIRAVYLQAKEEEKLISKCPVFSLPELGHELQVDHILPLNGRTVSGLHVVENLQILPNGLNMRKGNKCQK